MKLGVLAPPLRWFQFEIQDVNKHVNNKVPLPQAFDWNLYVCDLWSRLLLKKHQHVSKEETAAALVA